MPKFWPFLRRQRAQDVEERSSFDDWAADKLLFGGMSYPLGYGLSIASNVEDVENSFSGYVNSAYKTNGVVFATILARMLLFTEARFQFQRLDRGRPGAMFGTPDLAILERPWPNGTTGELLARMEQDVSLAGNFYAVREGNRLRRLRPDWVSIILTAAPYEAVASDVAGYLYQPGGLGGRSAAVTYLPSEVVHWSPIPDPDAQYRGMSWITPVLREITADKSAITHKNRYFENAAMPGMIVSFKESVTEEQFDQFKQDLLAEHQGSWNAFRPLFLAGGADARVLSHDFQSMDFKAVQGAGETRIAAAGGVPPIIVGLSEGLSSATYSNYGMARRKFGDHWARPQWRSVCAALSNVVRVPAGTRLWYDDTDVAFLREDMKDAAEIQSSESSSIRSLVDAGYIPETVVAAVIAKDWTLLRHSGLYSIQLMPPDVAEVDPATGPNDKPRPDPNEDANDAEKADDAIAEQDEEGTDGNTA